MNGTTIGGPATTLNRIALGLALVLFAALGAWWWRDHARAWETPRWERARFVALRAPASGAGPLWIVAVNLECSHCRARLADLLRRDAAHAAGARLGVLLVDTPARPDSLAAGARFDGGVWWDSLAVWRNRWGHRVYAETFVFGADGRLVRLIAPEQDPGPATTR